MKEHSTSMVPVILWLPYTRRTLFYGLYAVRSSSEGKTMELLFIPIMLNRAIFHSTENVLLVIQSLNICSFLVTQVASEVTVCFLTST